MENKEFKNPVVDLIRVRSSWRSYRSDPLPRELRKQLEKYNSDQTTGPFGSSVRFQLIQKDDPAVFDNVKLGTYGFIKNARNFIAGAVQVDERHWEDYGYLLERIILKMTDLELATCWLGGTFKRSEFGALLGVKENEVVPAITPVGYATKQRSLRDLIIRRSARSRTRKPWEWLFFDGEFGRPLSQPAAGKYATVLEMVHLAPSASNRQPWRIVKADEKFHLYLKRSRNYSEVVKSADLQRVDMGIAMCHFELSAGELGLSGKWVVEPPAIKLPELVEYICTWLAD